MQAYVTEKARRIMEYFSWDRSTNPSQKLYEDSEAVGKIENTFSDKWEIQ